MIQHPVEVSTAILLGTALLLSPYLLAGARGSRRRHCASVILVAIGTTLIGTKLTGTKLTLKGMARPGGAAAGLRRAAPARRAAAGAARAARRGAPRARGRPDRRGTRQRSARQGRPARSAGSGALTLRRCWSAPGSGARAGRALLLMVTGPRTQAQARLTDVREAVVAPLAAASARLRAGLGPPAAPQLAEPAAPRSAADDAAAWLGGALRPLRELVSASAPSAEGVPQPGRTPAVQEPEAEGAGAWVGGALRGLGLQWGSQARAESPRAVADGAAGAGRDASAPAADELPLLGGALRRLQQVRARRVVQLTAMRHLMTWAPLCR